jgi:hypothetical protein
MTGGARLSVRAAGRPLVGLLWAKTVAALLRERSGLRGWAAGLRKVCSFFSIFNSYFQIYLNKQTNFKFKPRFESKHPKTMHQHVCNSKLLYFIN